MRHCRILEKRDKALEAKRKAEGIEDDSDSEQVELEGLIEEKEPSPVHEETIQVEEEEDDSEARYFEE